MIRSLRAWASLWILVAMTAGLVASWLWFSSAQAWQDHLARAERIGHDLAAAVLLGAPVPPDTRLAAMAGFADDAPPPAAVEAGLPNSARITTLAFRQYGPDGAGQGGGARLQVQVVSASTQYPVAELASAGEAYAGMAALSRRLAQICSDPVLFLRADNGPWWRVDSTVWACAAQPRDLRLGAVALLGLALAALLTHAAELANRFRDLAQTLSSRRRPGETADLALTGPEELRETIIAVNGYLADERARLARRAMVLSGVSHDLGTPATRLRLRAALIEDPELRARFEEDLDRMGAMIEEVLTFTRAEIAAEGTREFCLAALTEAVVDDYRDTGQPVQMTFAPPASINMASTVFGLGRPRRVALPEMRRLLFTGRPLALERALSNLIDNALKYGRRADITLRADSEQVVLEVQDAGRELDPDSLRRLTDPFQRGPNVTDTDGTPISGFGMGLSIVATIAAQHGGELEFEQRPRGLCARLVLPRA
jgi:signal transduction histidine kinase